MISNWLIRALIVEYAVIMAVCLIEHRWLMGLYWFGALILNTAILWGFK